MKDLDLSMMEVGISLGIAASAGIASRVQWADAHKLADFLDKVAREKEALRTISAQAIFDVSHEGPTGEQFGAFIDRIISAVRQVDPS